jgi:hypothetical protein
MRQPPISQRLYRQVKSMTSLNTRNVNGFFASLSGIARGVPSEDANALKRVAQGISGENDAFDTSGHTALPA